MHEPNEAPGCAERVGLPPVVRSGRPTGTERAAQGRDSSGRGRQRALQSARDPLRVVRILGPSSVTAMVCSKWAPREPSVLRSVQPSGSMR